MKLKKTKNNILNWLKNIAYDSKSTAASGYNAYGHCPNFATRCCLTCDKCWKNYH